jgi:hypothetical protein
MEGGERERESTVDMLSPLPLRLNLMGAWLDARVPTMRLSSSGGWAVISVSSRERGKEGGRRGERERER